MARIDRLAATRVSMVAISIGIILLLSDTGQAVFTTAVDRLTPFKNMFVAGGFVANGKSLWHKGNGAGVATASFTITGVPDPADLVAAYLYVQTSESVQWAGADRLNFDGHDLGPKEDTLAKALTLDCTLAAAPCATIEAGGPSHKLITYRADVLPFLLDNNEFLPDGVTPNPTFKTYLANGTHTVKAPDASNQSWPASETGPRAIGAALVQHPLVDRGEQPFPRYDQRGAGVHVLPGQGVEWLAGREEKQLWRRADTVDRYLRRQERGR